MTGFEVSEAELDHARTFLRAISGTAFQAADQRTVTLRKSDLVRAMAWYGSIRSQSGGEPKPLLNGGIPLEQLTAGFMSDISESEKG